MIARRNTIRVQAGALAIGGDAPVSAQTMTDTDTSDAVATAFQAAALARAGAELVRVAVNTSEAAAAVPEIAARLHDAGIHVPLAGDFHYNGHRLLREHPACAKILDKYRINPGNVGAGSTRDDRFHDICSLARDLGKAVRIGVNAGSLNQDLVRDKMRENAASADPLPGETVISACMIASTLQSLELALQAGLPEDRIVLSCKSSRPSQLIEVYRALSSRTRQPLHLGLTEAGPGLKGLVWSAAAISVLLAEGIGDTIRVSLTPRPGGDRCEEVYAAQEILQALGLRRFLPSVTACPGCGRTTSAFFQRLAEDTQDYLRRHAPEWRVLYPGAESLEVAVMGCVVNGPGESRAANIGISLPGAAEAPMCPVYADGEKVAVLRGNEQEIARAFLALVDEYVRRHYPRSATDK